MVAGELAGRVVAITGGARGIGLATARHLQDLGAKVAVGDVDPDALAKASSELGDAPALPLAVTDPDSFGTFLDQVEAELGPLDVLVHAAATGVIRPALETEDRHWDWTLSANARALLSLTRAAAPRMPDGASIVGVSSLGSARVLDNYTLVGVSKAALEALVRYLAVELAPRGIRVNAVSAGVVETGALEHFPNKEAMLEMGERNPVGRMVTPEDVARAVTFLCSEDANMIRGHTLVVDGGWSLLTNIGGATGA